MYIMKGTTQKGRLPWSSLCERTSDWDKRETRTATYQWCEDQRSYTEPDDHKRHAESDDNLGDLELLHDATKISRNDGGGERDRHYREGAYKCDVYTVDVSDIERTKADGAADTYTTCTHYSSFAGPRGRSRTM